MCGILGTIPNTNKNHFNQALNTLAHRGPDDFGVYHNEDISLGHRRLSIIDLSDNAKQPMAYESMGGGNIILFLMAKFIIFWSFVKS